MFASKRNITVVAITVAAALIFGVVEAAGYHHADCHDEGNGPCPICLHVKSPKDLPESPPQPPAPSMQQRLALPALPRLDSRPLFAVDSRAPPFELL